jgi:hypothetical protein
MIDPKEFAKELRIGNWLNPDEPEFKGKYFQIDAGDIKHIRDGMKTYKYAPIPLTPEILIACGFKKFIDMEVSKKEKKDIYMYFLKTDYVQITFVFGVTVLIGNDGLGTQAQCDISGKIKSLHALQNLHFVLTGKELTYNPSK